MLSTESCVGCMNSTSSCYVAVIAYCMPSRNLCKLCNQAGTPHPVELAVSGGWCITRGCATGASSISELGITFHGAQGRSADRGRGNYHLAPVLASPGMEVALTPARHPGGRPPCTHQ